MESVLLRAALAPSLALLASLVARRMGPRRGGQLLGAPTTTGPFLAMTWMNSGPTTTASAAQGGVAGMLVVACYSLAYARFAPARRPARTLLLALLCALGAAVVGPAFGNVWLSAALTSSVIVLGLLTWPDADPAGRSPGPARRWEIPTRMALSGVIVTAALITTAVIGPLVGGVLAALPVLLSVMGPSIHRTAGAAAAADLMRGALTSVAGTLGFLLVLSFAPLTLGPAMAFLLALAAFAATDSLVRHGVARVRTLALARSCAVRGGS
ncbi:hypothetical protein ABZ464_19915 [Streptomyces sp. NPDC005820]|uniref:hypothetical protein n=1 Tax=Streptomyces sp. NPDC005820 TaxID=3157069 RepID=UPI0033E536EB